MAVKGWAVHKNRTHTLYV